jgi:hypothetical protein
MAMHLACLKIENEPHFLLDCNLIFKINNDKIRLFMKREVPNFNIMDIKQQFVFLMINEDIIISFISDIVFKNFQMREKMD